MTWKGKLAAVGVVVAVLLGVNDIPEGPIALVVVAAAVGLAWRFIDRFWKTVAFGVAAGAVAGLLILGPGLRIAMRVVAIMDPVQTPEFSFGGTMFIVVGIGGIFGGIFGIIGNLIRKAAGIKSVIAGGLILGTLFMTTLLLDSGLREEFFELGAGPWVNIPMFAVFTFAYGIAAMAGAAHLALQTGKPAVTMKEEVPA